MARRLPECTCGIILFSWLVLQCVQNGLSSPTGLSNALSEHTPQHTGLLAKDTAVATPTEDIPPSCPGKENLLHIEASDKARKALTGWLGKDTIRLIFIYFDLVVGNLNYHPGSCPHPDKSAIVAETPLAWVLSNGESNGGGSIASHSFAHAYLTLPVSYPRIYSMGILDGHYIGYMRHDVYRMEVVVNSTQHQNSVNGDCWNELNKTEKASLMLQAVQGFVSELDQSTAENTTKWTMCYTDPTSKDLPFSTSPLVPHTPAYVCQDEEGSMERLERDSFLKVLFVLFVFLSFGALAFQLYAFSKGVRFLQLWGEQQVMPLSTEDRKLFHDERQFFDKTRLPAHVTIGGLLSSDIVFGKQAFVCLKRVVFLGVTLFLYAIWPNLFVQSILNPTSLVARLGVSPEETFGFYLSCYPNVPPGPSLSLTSTGFYCTCGPLFWLCYSLLLLQDDPKAEGSIRLLSLSVAPIQRASSIFLNALAYLRIILLFPFRMPHYATHLRDTGSCPVRLTVCAFILAQLLFWMPFLLIFGFLATICMVGEIFEITGFTTLCMLGGLESSGTFILWVFLCLPAIILYIEGSELLMFLLFSSISLYITYPLPTFLVVSWSVALVAEAQNTIHNYRAPLLFVQEKFMEKMESIARNHLKLDEEEPSRLCLQSVSESGQDVNWTKFFHLLEDAWDSVCLQLLSQREINFTPLQSRTRRDEDEPYVALLFKLLDVRTDAEILKSSTRSKLQNLLWMRIFQGLVKLGFQVIVFLAIIMFLVAFNSLWKDPNPKDTNSLLLTILVVPLYTFVRTKLSPSSVSRDETILVEKLIDKELKDCFNNSTRSVSANPLFTNAATRYFKV